MTKTNQGRLLAYNIYITRKASMDQESHHRHLTEVNTPIIKPLLEKYGAVSYSVVSIKALETLGCPQADDWTRFIMTQQSIVTWMSCLVGGTQSSNEFSADCVVIAGMPVEKRPDVLLPYDTVVSIVVPNVDCINRMRSDPDFLSKYMPDHDNFADMSRSRTSLGWVEAFSFQE
ncbi:Dehydratase CTB10 [Fulvia fulva]|nr:Dehydratase CTB10 [Fulvia fulva]WPV17846.1 Dehydratase CTB10 [Fulvia fulva]WPV32968.1 Dehydratase CTB10 [Fulvia fulva]